MVDSQSNPNPSTLSKHSNIIETTRTSKDFVCPRRRIPQHSLLVWLDPYINELKQNDQHMMIQLRNIASNLHIFNQRDECIDFLTDAFEEKLFLITDSVTGEEMIPLIHDLTKLDAIYILSEDKLEPEMWMKAYTKVQGVHRDVTPICNSLQQVMKQTNQDSIAMSFVPSDQDTATQNLDQLEPSFMYTQLFKEILFTMEYDAESIKSFATYCRDGKYGSMQNIDRFEKEYSMHSPIWWYTFPSFIYEILNAALRMLEAETMIEMGFFLCDLHNEIEKLYQQQVVAQRRPSFIVYRGQGLSIADFEKLQMSKNGLLSFNSFLSTSENYDLSFRFAQIAVTNIDMVGVFFKIFVDHSVSSTPFAFVEQLSYFRTEAEVLFSMHSIFRIGHIEKIACDRTLYQVDLKLTADDDQQLRFLTNRMREETNCSLGMNRLCLLLTKIGKFDKAEYICEMLLHQELDQIDEAYFYSNLGYLKSLQNDQESALLLCRRALTIRERILPPDHPHLAASYTNLALAYSKMGEYSKALSFLEKVLEMRQKTLPPYHPDLATSCNNLALVYDGMGEYSKALSFHEKAFEIRQKCLPPNHPELADSYNNISSVYGSMGEYSKALSLHEKAFEIRQKSLPSNHPDLAMSYNNIALVYNNMGDYSKALSYAETALDIRQKTSPDHPDLAVYYDGLALTHNKMGEYLKAFSFHEKALEIQQRILPPNHPYLASSYSNIALLYDKMGEYSKALSFHEKAFEIRQKSLPSNHRALAISYNNIALVYNSMREYSKALIYFEKACEMVERILPPNHPDLAIFYSNIGIAYDNNEEYFKALIFHDKAINIQETVLSPNHPDLAISYNNIASIYYKAEEYSEALSLWERSLIIFQASLPSNHPDMELLQKNIEHAKRNLSVQCD